MEQNTEPINKYTSLWSINIFQRGRTYNGIKIVYLLIINGVRKIGQIQAKK